MKGLWRSWLWFEAWLIEGLLPAPAPAPPPVDEQPRATRSRSGRSGASSPGSGASSRGRRTRPQGSKQRRASAAEDHLPFDLVAAYISIGLPYDATKAVVRQRLRQLMKEAHPDRHPPERAERAARRMRELSRARDTLRRYGRLP